MLRLNEPLVIGIVGDDPFGSLLKEAVEGESYHNRPIVIEHSADSKDIRHCHLLFVGRTENARIDAILAAVSSGRVSSPSVRPRIFSTTAE